jgi:SAM-dependent methyltransferase
MNVPFPLRTAAPQTFDLVRRFLAQSGYTEEFLLNHFSVPGLHLLLTPFGLAGEYLHQRYRGDSLPLFLARTFIAGYPAIPQHVERFLPQPVTAALRELGTLEPVPDKPADLRATVLLIPSRGFFIAADRGFWVDGIAHDDSDFVMCGLENISRRFVDHFAKSPCRHFLEIGCGSGYAALVASTFAGQVTAIDITERAVRYGEFNRLLNGAHNVRILQGDLFAPVAGMQFDRIASHPPFEPSLKGDYVFSVGGEDGEALIARIVSEGPAYLEPGGRMYIQVTGTDREGEPFEDRIRKWLGAAAEECDVALFVRISTKPMDYATEQVLAQNADAWKLQEWSELYHKLKAELVVLGHLVIQRRLTPRPVFFTRRSFGPTTTIAEMEWLLDWETRAAEPGFHPRLLSSAPAHGAGWELYTRHHRKDGKLEQFSSTFFTTYPFETSLHCAAWMPLFVSRCNGTTAAAEHLQWLRTRFPIAEEDFLRALSALISTGVLLAPES